MKVKLLKALPFFFVNVLISQSIRNECQLLSVLFLIYFSFKSIVALRAILRIYDLWSFFLLDPDPILHFPTNDQKVFAIYTHTKLANSHDVILNFFAQFNYRICVGIFCQLLLRSIIWLRSTASPSVYYFKNVVLTRRTRCT